MPGKYEPPDSGDASPEVKRILREVYQSCREDNPGEDHEKKEKCARIAWAAVKKAGYHQDEDGKWVKDSDKQHTARGDIVAITSMDGVVSEPSSRAYTMHKFENTTLQKLDDWIPDEKTGEFNPVEPYAKNVSTWNDIPVVYGGGGVHPDLKQFKEDPEAAMEAVSNKTGERCEIVGSISNPRVEQEGQPRLMANLSFDDDEAYHLWEEGKLRVSTALFVRTKDKRVIEVMEANHVLIYPSEAAGQGDKGAIIMNTAPLVVQVHNEDDMKKIDDVTKALDKLTQILNNLKADEAKINADAKDYVPNNPPGYGKADEATGWAKPNLGDFTDKRWEDLAAGERRDIASCYAYVGDLSDFGSLSLPHHDPDTKSVVWNGVHAAMAAALGARGGVDLGTKSEEVISHLADHYKDFDKEVPKSAGETQTKNTRAVGRDEMTNTEIDELKDKLRGLEAEAKTHTDAIAAKEGEVTTLKKSVTDLEAKMNTLTTERDDAVKDLKKYRDAETEARFQAVLNTLPKGLYHKDEDKAALKKQFTEDPAGFISTYAAKMNTTGKTTGETGEEHDVKNTADMTREEYMQNRRTIGGKDPKTGKLAGEQ